MKLKEMYPEWRDKQLKLVEREQQLATTIENTEFSVPGNFHVENLGTYAIRLFVYPKDPGDVEVLANELGSLFKVSWKLEFDGENGTFYYKTKKEKYYADNQHLLLFIRNAPTPSNCKIVKKTKKVNYFEKVCSQE